MVKQCPRCWDKVSPDVKICPNCGYDFVRMAAPGKAAKAEAEPKAEKKKREIVFPTPKVKEEDDTDIVYKVVYFLILAWAVLAVLSGIFYFATGAELIQGAGMLLSGIVSAGAFYLFRERRYHIICWILVLVSGAATFRMELLLVALAVSILVLSCSKHFKK